MRFFDRSFFDCVCAAAKFQAALDYPGKGDGSYCAAIVRNGYLVIHRFVRHFVSSTVLRAWVCVRADWRQILGLTWRLQQDQRYLVCEQGLDQHTHRRRTARWQTQRERCTPSFFFLLFFLFYFFFYF